jgi:Right handed beta helix region
LPRYRTALLGLLLVAVGCATERTGTGPPLPPGTRAGYYVTPGGSSSGDGSSAAPWNLATGLAGGSGKVQPGDTIWLRGGTYHGAFTSTVSGIAGAPVVVRGYPGERATIDGNGQTNDLLVVESPWVVFEDFEIMDSNTDRVTTSPQRPHGVVNNAPHVKYVHLIVHDVGIGFYTYANQSVDVEIYGCLIYNNGWQGGGHAIYGKADVGPLLIRDNITFTQFGYGIHVYSDLGDGHLYNITVRGNVSFDNGSLDGPASVHANLLVGGADTARADVVDSNMTYYAPSVGEYNTEMGFSTTPNYDVVFRDNYAVGGASRAFQLAYWRNATVTGNVLYAPGYVVDVEDTALSGYTWTGNTLLRDPTASAWSYHSSSYTFAGWKSATGLGGTDQATATLPTTPKVFVRRSVYEPSRATIVVYNWGNQSTVPVDVSTILQSGDTYEVRNAQDFFAAAPVLSGQYAGGALSVPMAGVTPPLPVGGSPGTPPQTGPAFNVFILRKPAS